MCRLHEHHRCFRIKNIAFKSKIPILGIGVNIFYDLVSLVRYPIDVLSYMYILRLHGTINVIGKRGYPGYLMLPISIGNIDRLLRRTVLGQR